MTECGQVEFKLEVDDLKTDFNLSSFNTVTSVHLIYT